MGRIARVMMAGALAATAVGAVAPAEAHVGAGGAIIAGLAGLGLGAAIASDHPHRYYGGGYGYAPPPPPAYGYGYAPPPAPVAYEYAPPPPPAYGYEEVRQCRVTSRWDGWRGRYVPVRHCW